MNNLNYVDLAVFIILLIEIIKGIKSGIIVPMFDIVGIIAGWFIAKANAVNFAPLVDKTLHITSYVSPKVANSIKLPSIVANAPATNSNVSAAFISLHLPEFIQKFLLQNVQPSQTITVQQYIVNTISYSILLGIAFIILFVLVLIIFRIVGVLVRKAFRVSPFLKWVDAVFGAVFRFLVVFVILYIIASVIITSVSYLNLGNSAFIVQLKTSKFYAVGNVIFPFLKNKVIGIIAPILK